MIYNIIISIDLVDFMVSGQPFINQKKEEGHHVSETILG